MINRIAIAKNTTILFVRILVVTIINLYSVRLLINGLGTQDYGLFTAIAGVVTTSSCVVSVFSLSLQRFYSYYIGKDDFPKLKSFFSASINIVCIFSLIIIILFETIGLWFVNTKMTIPYDRITVCMAIFQFAIFTFIFSFLQVPMMACVFAHEDMGLYAFLSCFECIAKLIAALLIGHFFIENLLFYGSSILLIAFILLLSYYLICRIRYKECKYKYKTPKSIYKKLLSFTGWSMLGSVAGMGHIQGSIILLNVFFGPITNAAFAISNNIYNAFNALTNSIVLAFRPVVIKSYAQEEFNRVNRLFSIENKFIAYMLSCIGIPVIIEIESILILWLGQTTQETILFSKMFVIYTIFMALHNPITTIIQATAKIKWYYILTDSLSLIHIPISFFLFQIKFDSYYIFISLIIICILAHFIRIIYIRLIYNYFSIRRYIQTLLLPIIIIYLCFYSASAIHCIIATTWLRIIVIFIYSPLIIILFIILFELNKEDRKQLIYKIKQHI